MMSVREALDLVVANAGRQELDQDVLTGRVGRVLAEDVFADADSPPFDKSMMDGYAVRAADVVDKKPLRVLGEIRAGSTQDLFVGESETVAIMTGAPIPKGADAVVVVERCQVADGTMTTDVDHCKAGANILRRGEEYKKGEPVLKRGRLIGPGEIAVLASVGDWHSDVFKRPEVAVAATGDELIDFGWEMQSGKIRDTNTPTLEALLSVVGAEVFRIGALDEVGVAPDDLEPLRQVIHQGMEADMLLLTGGVSMGTADFVPRVLFELGVNEVFHKVALKPGMPVWFGTHEKGLVFGLPGNPVSVLVCFELFVTTALRARQGWSDPLPRFVNARLEADFNYPTKRETYHPARLTFTDDGPVVSPVPWFGSADVLGASRADALVVLPVGPGEHKTGDRLRVLPLSKPGWVWTCSGAGGAS